MAKPTCETCKRELQAGETVYQGDLTYDLSVFPPTARVPYLCEECGDKR